MKKSIKVVAFTAIIASLLSFVGCSKSKGSKSKGSGVSFSYADVEVGKSYTDITAKIKLMTHRTDMLQDGYTGVPFSKYLEEFKKVYPNITVEIEGITDYASISLLRLQGGDWGDIMMIPSIDKKELSNYFMSFGSLDEMTKEIKFASNWEYDGLVYGIPSTGNA